jgi:hypothetical protein
MVGREGGQVTPDLIWSRGSFTMFRFDGGLKRIR